MVGWNSNTYVCNEKLTAYVINCCNSRHWRSREFCRLCIRTSYSCHSIGSTQRPYWVCQCDRPHVKLHRINIHSSILGSYFLKERLGVLGKLGCAICLIGSLIIILHAPPDKDVETVDQILEYAVKPGTGFYLQWRSLC